MPTTLYEGASVGRSMNPALPLSAVPVAPIASSVVGLPKMRDANPLVIEMSVSGRAPGVGAGS
jgi:hypothetical protein